MPIHQMTLPVQRRSAIHIPRRDLQVGAGDELVLRVSLVETDRPDAAPIPLARQFARVRMFVWQDAQAINGRADYGLGYRGPVLTSHPAMVTGDRTTSVDIKIGADATLRWMASGRLGWSMQAALSTGNQASLCWGALHMRPGLGMPNLHVLTDDYENVLTDEPEYVVI